MLVHEARIEGNIFSPFRKMNKNEIDDAQIASVWKTRRCQMSYNRTSAFMNPLLSIIAHK